MLETSRRFPAASGCIEPHSIAAIHGTRRVSQLTQRWTYHEVVEAEYGKPGLMALKVAIIINNAGSMVCNDSVQCCCFVVWFWVGCAMAAAICWTAMHVLVSRNASSCAGPAA
jgi:hypothetical protein